MLNDTSMNENNKEYELLDAISQDPLVTQAGLSDSLGIAVGSVNWYIKRLIMRGYVKVTHMDRTRLKYDLTPEGMTILTQRALQYMKSSLRFYTDLRAKARTVVSDLKSRGIEHAFLEGNDEVADILRLTCIEGGILLSDVPDGVILKTEGQNYQVIFKEVPRS
jgi:predicted transcriptional regulator